MKLEIYDLRGSLVERRELGEYPEGESRGPMFLTAQPASGVYLYRLQLRDPSTGALRATLQGKTMIVR